MIDNKWEVFFPRLMHLADSALPIGGFAFSNGLEWMVKTGNIQTVDAFSEYLKDLITQAASFDLIFIVRFCKSETMNRARKKEKGPKSVKQLKEDNLALLDEYDLLMQSPGIRRSSLIQGKSWLTIFPDLFAPLFPEYNFDISYGDTPHFLYVFSRSLYICDIPTQWISRLYLYMIVRDQINASIRLGCIGPGTAQRIQAGIYGYFEEVIMSAHHEVTEGSSRDDPYYPARQLPMLEIAQGAHNSLYSTLFQN